MSRRHAAKGTARPQHQVFLTYKTNYRILVHGRSKDSPWRRGDSMCLWRKGGRGGSIVYRGGHYERGVLNHEASRPSVSHAPANICVFLLGKSCSRGCLGMCISWHRRELALQCGLLCFCPQLRQRAWWYLFGWEASGEGTCRVYCQQLHNRSSKRIFVTCCIRGKRLVHWFLLDAPKKLCSSVEMGHPWFQTDNSLIWAASTPWSSCSCRLELNMKARSFSWRWSKWRSHWVINFTTMPKLQTNFLTSRDKSWIKMSGWCHNVVPPFLYWVVVRARMQTTTIFILIISK